MCKHLLSEMQGCDQHLPSGHHPTKLLLSCCAVGAGVDTRDKAGGHRASGRGSTHSLTGTSGTSQADVGMWLLWSLIISAPRFVSVYDHRSLLGRQYVDRCLWLPACPFFL
jgi:hypothetical protein